MQNIILRKVFLTTTIISLLLGVTAFNRLHADEPQPAFRMACIFTDHMVLQRDQPLPAWGWAAPGRSPSPPGPVAAGWEALAFHAAFLPGVGRFASLRSGDT